MVVCAFRELRIPLWLKKKINIQSIIKSMGKNLQAYFSISFNFFCDENLVDWILFKKIIE